MILIKLKQLFSKKQLFFVKALKTAKKFKKYHSAFLNYNSNLLISIKKQKLIFIILFRTEK